MRNCQTWVTRPNRARVLAALQNVIEDFEVSDLTIAQKEVLDLIQKHYPAASVTISTIAGVKTREQIREYSHYSVVRRICAHHDLNRNTILLRRCVDESGEYGIDLELMLTENCVNQCPIRDIHYAVLGRNANKGEKIDEYQIPCWLDKLRSPEEIIGASWITPKGISFYESLGIHEFKITGRDKDKKRLPLVVEAYFNRSFDGNLMRLLGTAPQSVTKMAVEAENLVFLDTEAMDGFYEKLDRALANGISYEEFCRKITVSLFREGSLVLLDSDSRYEAADGKVICQRCGQFYRNTLEYVQDKRVYELWKNIRNQKG